MKALDASNEVKIKVNGRRTRRTYWTRVWFVQDGKTVFLLAGGGSKSQWYKNAIKLNRLKVCSRKLSLDLTATPMTDSNRLMSVVEKFRKKDGSHTN